MRPGPVSGSRPIGDATGGASDACAVASSPGTARARPQDEFPDSQVIERIDGLVPNKPGALLGWLQKTSDRGYLIDEIVVGIPDPTTPDMVPPQISVINPGGAG